MRSLYTCTQIQIYRRNRRFFPTSLYRRLNSESSTCVCVCVFVFVCVCVCGQILSWYLQDEDTFTRIIKAERVVFAAIGFDVQIFTGLSLAHRVRFRLSLDPGLVFTAILSVCS